MQHPKFYIAIALISLPFISCQDYRLPETVIPSRYVVDLFVSEGVFRGENDTFDGEVTMTFTVTNSTSDIKLHHRLNLTEVAVTTAAGQDVTVSSTEYNNVTEILTVSLQNALTIDATYNLYIRYYGIFDNYNMRGFYVSSYPDENNQTSYMVLSKFEPVHSRHAFPCLDEPQYKATYVLSLTYPTGLNALANTVVSTNSTLDNGYTKTTFQETTIMSTYLLAFAISSFTCTEGYSIAEGVPHGVCSRPEETANRAWALEVGTSVLRALESLTGLKYGNYMPKMDQLAVPDFASGAMENWGLVSYREAYLLWSEEDSTNNYKKSVATIVSHEFTHMWFGNVVTCKWWDYTFLNEGFASFYEYFATAMTKQTLDWELDKHFNVEMVHRALLADSSSGALSLTSPSASPSDISGKFGTISYSKGAAILRMIEKNIMGESNFIYGIRDYLKTYEFRATVPDNVWSSFAKYVPSNALPAGIDFVTTLNNWVELSGHPVVIVSKNGDDVILSQERFLLSGNSTRQYYVPITYTVSKDITTFSNTTVTKWLIPNETLTLSGVLSASSWIVLNNRQAGFYRVDYDSSLWSAIKSQLHSNHLSIDVLNRAQLISDAYNFARAGHNTGYGTWTYADLLDLLSYLHHEEDYYPWYATIVGNNHLLQRIGYDTEIGQRFTTWMLSLMEQVLDTVPFDVIDDSNQVYSMKKTLILTRACKYDHPVCVTKAKELFANYRTTGTKIPKNIRTFVYCTALRHSNDVEGDFSFLWQKYSETKFSTDILSILSGLGCTADTTSVKWLLSQTINATSGIRLQDFSSVWSYVYSSGQLGTNAVFEYITENYAELTKAYASVGTLISNAANYIYLEDQLEKLEILGNLTGISTNHKSTVESALSSAKSNIEWSASLAESVKIYLDAQKSGATISKASILLVVAFLFIQKLMILE